MLQLDALLLEFLSYNWISLSVTFGILKSVAVSCKWSKTNSILETIQGMFFSLRNGNFRNINKKENKTEEEKPKEGE